MTEEGEGSSEMVFTDIESNADSLHNSDIFHVIKSLIGFVLYMHQQIPSVLQDIGLEFDNLKEKHQELEMALAQAELKPSIRRQNLGRMREVKSGIRRLEKLMNAINALETALQLIISEIPNLHSFILIIGASPIRPQHVYEFCFSHGRSVIRGASDSDFTKSKAAEGLSRKAIRALIAKGAGSAFYPGPTKLFLLVKAPSSFNLPLHFLPKRDFRYSKKIVPVRLRVKCKCQDLEIDAPDCACQTNSSISLGTSTELIWFQCCHVVRGLAFMTPTEEE